MAATQTPEIRITAPVVLGLDTRTAFRQEAATRLALLPDDGRLVVDMGATRDVDSAGLGTLIAVHREAERRGVGVAIANASDHLRYLLTLTKLDDLFEQLRD